MIHWVYTEYHHPSTAGWDLPPEIRNIYYAERLGCLAWSFFQQAQPSGKSEIRRMVRLSRLEFLSTHTISRDLFASGTFVYLNPSLSSVSSLLVWCHPGSPSSVPTPSFTAISDSPSRARDTRHSHALTGADFSDEKIHCTSSVENLPAPGTSSGWSGDGSNRESSSTWYTCKSVHRCMGHNGNVTYLQLAIFQAN